MDLLQEGEDEDYFLAARRKREAACMSMMAAATAACVHHRQLIQAVFGTIAGAAVTAPIAASKAKKKRKQRRQFDYQAAYDNIQRDYAGPNALFGKEFHLFFRLSRPRVQKLMDDLANSGDPFYQSFRVDMVGRVGACMEVKVLKYRVSCFGRRGRVAETAACTYKMEVKVLLPLRCLAYGDPPHSCCSTFQVSVAHAREIYNRFLVRVYGLYKLEYLRLPTAGDLKAISTLHKAVHGVQGMLGSLDCMQTNWKNCPVEWQGYFKGGNSRKMSTIVLEAACDHNLWFWHASYGYPGSFNDINILQSSPLLQRLVDGSFVQTEQESGVVPFQIPGTERPFNHMFFLCDGIYPRYSRFIKTVKPTLSEDQAQFAQWQWSDAVSMESNYISHSQV